MISAKMELNNGIEFELIERLSAKARLSLDDARGKLEQAQDPAEAFVDVSRQRCRGRDSKKVKPFCRDYIVWAIAQMKSQEAQNDFRRGTS